MYAQTLLSVVMAEIISRILFWLRKHGTGLVIATARLATITLLSAGFAVVGLLLDVHTNYFNSPKNQKKVPLSELCAYLNRAQQWGGKTLRILTHVDFGPEILYRTDYEVIATPYHRNGQAMIDTYDIMTAETDNKARDLINNRGINMVLLCPDSSERVFYSTETQISTFYKRLRRGPIPDWLNRVELPDDLSSSFLIFEVQQSNHRMVKCGSP